MAGNLHHTTPAWYAWRDGPPASVTAHGAGRADGPELPQLPGSVHPGSGSAARSSPTLHLSGAQAGSMQLVFILSFALISPAFGWLGDRRTRFSAGRHWCLRLERRHRRLRACNHLRHPAGRARADRRRRGELHGRHAIPDLGFLSGRSARAGSGAVLRGDPDRIGGRLHDRRRDQCALGMARGVLRRGSTGRSTGSRPAHVPRSRSRYVRRRKGPGTAHGARHPRRPEGATELRLQHRRADPLYVRGRRPRVLDAHLLRGGAAVAARGGFAKLRHRAGARRFRGDADRRARG